MIIRLFLSLALFAATASSQCLVCLDGSAPGNPQAQVAAAGGLTCQYFYNAVDLPATSDQCLVVHTAENQAVCGCKTMPTSTPPQSNAPVLIVTSRAPLAPRAESSAPVVPPTASNAPVVPPTETSAPIVPVMVTSAPVVPVTVTSAPVVPVTVTSAPVIPVTVTSAPVIPVTVSSAPIVPVTVTSAPVVPVTVTSAPVVPVTVTSAPVVPPTESSAPVVPPTESSAPVVPPTESSAPVVPPTESSAPVVPPTESSAPFVPPTENFAPVVPPTESQAPITSNTLAPVMGSKPASSVAFVSSAPIETTSKTPAPVGSGSGSVTNAPVTIPISAPVVVPTSGAPISPSSTPAPVTAAPITAAPIESLPIAQPTNPDNFPPVVPSAPVAAAGTETSSPVAPSAPSCTGLKQDPYEFYGNGSFIPCCDSVDQCLGDWNNNSRVYYQCVEKGSCPNASSLLIPETPPAVCTGFNQDPYQVYGNGSYIPCCNPTKQCLSPWDGDSRYYFRCVDDCAPAVPVDNTPLECTSEDNDPFQAFGNQTEKKCCSGLVKCLDDWNDIDRYYYRCLECCDDSCAPTKVPTPTSNKTGIPSDQVSSFVMKPDEYGVFVQKSSLAGERTSGAFGMAMSMFGVFVTSAFAVLLM